MTLHADLIEQAKHLAVLDPKRPRQANLRRSVSTAYYALFHCLVDAGSQRVSRRRAGNALWHLIERRFAHGTMKGTSEAFGKKAPWVTNSNFPIPDELVSVAQAFVMLQEERHNADYNRQVNFTRARAVEAVESAADAIAAWDSVAKSDAATYYLLALLLGPPRA